MPGGGLFYFITMSILDFIKDNEISKREIEKELGMPEKSFKGVPAKWKEKIKEYLTKEYNYPYGYDKIGFERPQKVTPGWKGQNRLPGFKDGIMRYRDHDSGLWRKVTGVVDTDAELFEDEVGSYIIFKDYRVYTEFKNDEPAPLKWYGEMIKVYK